ncbi:MAG: fumarylacetoacetate hydrolase family protein [Chloroflexota bacterium]
MKFKKISHKNRNNQFIAVEINGRWQLLVGAPLDMIELLRLKEAEILSQFSLEPYDEQEYAELMPFQPTAYRDFSLYEQHAFNSAMGFVKKYMPQLKVRATLYQLIFNKPLPRLRPKALYYKHPIYYLGNHLNFLSAGDSIHIPAYTNELDYELELAAVITKPLINATVDEVTEAIGGFVILNDFSARDVQIAEMGSGFGPMKSKNFGNAISAIVAHKEQLINRINQLKVTVLINGQTIAENQTQGMLFTIQEAIAYASWDEKLHPGELFGFGTVPTCTGIENGHMLKSGDQITLEVEGIGQLTNFVQ